MDLFEELESIAVDTADDSDALTEPSEQELMTWRTLFGYPYPEAVQHIKEQRSDLGRRKVSTHQWDLVRSQKEAEGFTREAHEHWIEKGSQPLKPHGQDKPRSCPSSPTESTYHFLFDGILDTPDKIRDIASLSDLPPVVQASSEEGDAVFCRVNGAVKQRIITWLAQQKSSFKPTFVRLSKAKKDLAADSIYPTLGKESTLPQHRLDPSSSPISVDTSRPIRQNEYPVWYFFYGSLANPDLLARLLSLPEALPPELTPTSISGGTIKSWQGKYKALVDGADDDYVHGSAYKVVASKEHEEALMLYETQEYEVVRCRITMADHSVQGLTFRFAGSL